VVSCIVRASYLDRGHAEREDDAQAG
jgi:hypothetical protein